MLNDFLKRFFCAVESDAKIRLISAGGRVKVEVVGDTIVEATIDGGSWRLSKDDIRYLMMIDGHTRHEKNPPESIGFMLYGEHIEVSDEVWAVFSDMLCSIVGEMGWHLDFLG